MLPDDRPGTVGVEGGAGGVVFEVEACAAAFVWLADLGLSRDWLAELLAVPELEDNWLVCGCLFTATALLAEDSVLWLPLDSH